MLNKFLASGSNAAESVLSDGGDSKEDGHDGGGQGREDPENKPGEEAATNTSVIVDQMLMGKIDSSVVIFKCAYDFVREMLWKEEVGVLRVLVG